MKIKIICSFSATFGGCFSDVCALKRQMNQENQTRAATKDYFSI